MKVFALFGRPEFLRRFHGCATVFWIVMAPPSMLWWSQSIRYLVCLSVYAVVVGHWSSWQAARVEVRQEEEFDSEDSRSRSK